MCPNPGPYLGLAPADSTQSDPEGDAAFQSRAPAALHPHPRTHARTHGRRDARDPLTTTRTGSPAQPGTSPAPCPPTSRLTQSHIRRVNPLMDQWRHQWSLVHPGLEGVCLFVCLFWGFLFLQIWLFFFLYILGHFEVGFFGVFVSCFFFCLYLFFCSFLFFIILVSLFYGLC